MRLTLAAGIFCLLASAGSAAGADSDRSLALFFTGDVQGNFEPCGCAGGPTGGLSRRAGYARFAAEAGTRDQLHVDAGNYFADPGPSAGPVNRLMLDSLDRLPLAVQNLGVQDLHLWSELSRYTGGTRIISTNLTPRQPGTPVPRRYALIEVPVAGLSRPVRIGFLGLADPMRVKPNSGFRATDPIQAVAAVKSELGGEADLLVLLWDTIRPSISQAADWIVTRMAREHPELDLIITTEPRFVRYDPLQVGSVTIVSSIERGRFLGQALLRFDASVKLTGIEVDFIEMKDGMPEDPAFLMDQKALSARLQ